MLSKVRAVVLVFLLAFATVAYAVTETESCSG